jgi:excisionase family DNA binding protein
VLTVAEAAARTGRGEETIRRWIRAGRLAASRDGRLLRVHADELDALVARPGFELPPGWARTAWGSRQPDWVAEIRRARGHRRLPT